MGMFIPEGELELPKSLRTLHILGARLVEKGMGDWHRFNEYAMILPRSLTVSGIDGPEELEGLQAMLDATPRLRYSQVIPSKLIDLDSLKKHRPPVFLPWRLRPLVDRGIGILVRLPEGSNLELETCLPPP